MLSSTLTKKVSPKLDIFLWGRKKLDRLIDVLFDQQHVALLGFDSMFAEPDDSSGFSRLSELARTEFKDQAAFSEQLKQLQPELDYYSLCESTGHAPRRFGLLLH